MFHLCERDNVDFGPIVYLLQAAKDALSVLEAPERVCGTLKPDLSLLEIALLPLLEIEPPLIDEGFGVATGVLAFRRLGVLGTGGGDLPMSDLFVFVVLDCIYCSELFREFDNDIDRLIES